MKPVSFAAAVGAASGVLVLSCTALVLGLGTPQAHGWGFRLVTAGFLLQAIGAAMILARLVASRSANAPRGGTGTPSAD